MHRTLVPLAAPLAVSLATLLAFAIRLVRLGDSPIWWDEGWSVWLARQDVLAIAQRTAFDEHPPLHYWLLHLWTPLAGENPFSVRFSSVILGVLAVAALYRLGADLVHPGAGLLAALLLASSRFHVWWSQEIKMYSLVVLLALLSLLVFVRLVRTGRGRYHVLYVLVTLACLLTSYLSVLVLVVQNGLVLLGASLDRGRWRLSWPRWLALQGILGALALPWLLYFLLHAQWYQRTGAFEPLQALRLYLTVLPLGISTEIEYYTPLAFAFLSLALVGTVGAVLRWKRSALGQEGLSLESWLLPLIAVLVVPLALVVFTLPELGPYQPKVSERYLILFLPLYLLLLAYGLVWLWDFRRLLAVALALGSGGVFSMTLVQYLAERHPDHDEPALAYALSQFYRPGDVIVLNPDNNWPVWAYHLPIADQHWLRLRYGTRMSPQEAARWLTPGSTNATTVWLITDAQAAATDPGREVPRWLASHFPRVGERRFLRSRLALYSRDPSRNLERVATGRRDSQPPTLVLPTLALDEVGPLPRRLRAGQMAYLFTTWSASVPTSREYRARLVLRHGDGTVLPGRRWSALLEDGATGTWEAGETVLARHALRVPLSSEAGQYTVALEIAGASDQRATVHLGTIAVAPARASATSAPDLIPQSAVLGQAAIELLGYGLSADTLQPGDRLQVALRWLARTQVEDNATVFVHLSSTDDAVWATGDGIPGNGGLPTAAWSPGDVIDDPHILEVPPIAPAGVYTIFVGMYDPLTGQRLRAATVEGQALSQDRIALGTVTVTP